MPFDKYADLYDLIFCDREYDAECHLIESLFSKYGLKKPLSILDIGVVQESTQ